MYLHLIREAESKGKGGRSGCKPFCTADSACRYAYDFDDIGNRESSSERGTNSVYAANNLNQYTAITDVAATPSSSQTFQPQFDDDGNKTLIKTATGIWSVTYNGENRPILWTSTQQPVNPSIGQSVNQTISMSYDRMGRRVAKNNQRFIYDGYLQVADNCGNDYIWNPTEKVATRPLVWNCGAFPTYYVHDGNKNVSEVVAENGDIAAHYEYAPFGAVIAQCGASTVSNPWRFSSEYAEDGTATVYYNYRHYEPETGRWMSRDPIEEKHSCPYGFCMNCTQFKIDVFGLSVTGYVDPAYFNVCSCIGRDLYKNIGSPTLFDQMFGGWSTFNFDRSYEKYFEERYHDTLDWYRRDIMFKISREIDCKSTRFLPKNHSKRIEGGYIIYPFMDNLTGEAVENDRQQGYWERNCTLGTFTIDISPVVVSYGECHNGKRRYTWETEMFVVDTVGLQPRDGIKYELFGRWLFINGTVIMARWKLSGEGVCSYCKESVGYISR